MNAGWRSQRNSICKRRWPAGQSHIHSRHLGLGFAHQLTQTLDELAVALAPGTFENDYQFIPLVRELLFEGQVNLVGFEARANEVVPIHIEFEAVHRIKNAKPLQQELGSDPQARSSLDDPGEPVKRTRQNGLGKGPHRLPSKIVSVKQ